MPVPVRLLSTDENTNQAHRIHRYSTRFIPEFVGGGDNLGERALSIDGKAYGRTPLGKVRSGLVDMDVEVRLVEESVGEGGAG